MNLNTYEVFALFYIPISLVMWILDFLSDKDITKNEFEIGLYQYTHHLFAVLHMGILILLLTTKDLPVTIITIIIILIAQIGFLINNDSCWFLTLTNIKINPDRPNRKWRAEIGSLIKHYIRGDEWAYSDINQNVNYTSVKLINTLAILHLLKMLI
jgi:hypothetical protein